MRTRIKICGMRRAEDALAAAAGGADAIGLIFYAGSPRAVDIAAARAIADVLPPFVSTVALFVNAEPGDVHDVCRTLRPSLLQFHGDETAAYCESFAWPYLKAIRVGAGMKGGDLLQFASQFASSKALLLDTLAAGHYGGSGQSFDWSVIPAEMRSRIVLSGGLNPENVAAAVRAVRPYAVDVSSGVEAQKGVKDHARMQSFINQVKVADQHADV